MTTPIRTSAAPELAVGTGAEAKEDPGHASAPKSGVDYVTVHIRPIDVILLAAAPAMIEALKSIVDQEAMQQHDPETRMHDMADIARAAIKLATEE